MTTMTAAADAPPATKPAPTPASPPTATPTPYTRPRYVPPAPVPLPPLAQPAALADTLRAADAVPLAIALLSWGACPRCCLRFAGVREAGPYEGGAPSAGALLAELRNGKGGGGTAVEGEGTVVSDADCGPSEGPNPSVQPGPTVGPVDAGTAPPAGDASAPAAAAAAAGPPAPPPPSSSPTFDPPCSICVGVLQSLDAPTPPLPPRLMEAASNLDAGVAEWRPAASAHPATLAAAFRAEGHECGAATLQILYPASAAVRQVCAVEALRAAGLWDGSGGPVTAADDDDCGDLGGPPPAPARPRHHYRPRTVVDVKDALRLALTGPLGRALGRRLGGEGEAGVDVALALQFLHPGSACEPDALAASGAVAAGGKRGRGARWKGPHMHDGGGQSTQGEPTGSKKRGRHGPPPPPIGRAATAPFIASLASVGPPALASAGLPCPPLPPTTPSHLVMRVRRAPLLVGGYYTKSARDISQSPFFAGKTRLGRCSVQEGVEAALLPALRADGAKFVTAGREDMDVRMLGRGRPFVMEVLNARARVDWGGGGSEAHGGGGVHGGADPSSSSPSPSASLYRHRGTTYPPSLLADAEAAINAAGTGVGAHALTLVTRAALAAIKAGEASKEKSYRAAVTLPVPATPEMLARLNAVRGLVLAQTTPTRVEARRAMLVRHRTVHELAAEVVGAEGEEAGVGCGCGGGGGGGGGGGDGDAAPPPPIDPARRISLTLRTQAGLYVKEFVHGDGGRTVPDLAAVAGCPPEAGPAAITALDVLAVHLDFV